MTLYHLTSISPGACVLGNSKSTELNDRRSSGSGTPERLRLARIRALIAMITSNGGLGWPRGQDAEHLDQSGPGVSR
jgi:hypothetical protein